VAFQYAQNPDAPYDTQALDDGTLRIPISSVTHVGAVSGDSLSSLAMIESPCRTSGISVASASMARRSSKSHRSSSIFDEDIKQRFIHIAVIYNINLACFDIVSL
jgi:hypothetical protein